MDTTPDPQPSESTDRVDRVRELATLDALEADIALVDAAMRHAEEGDLDAAEVAARRLDPADTAEGAATADLADSSDSADRPGH